MRIFARILIMTLPLAPDFCTACSLGIKSGPPGNRTPNLLIKSQLLYQLS